MNRLAQEQMVVKTNSHQFGFYGLQVFLKHLSAFDCNNQLFIDMGIVNSKKFENCKHFTKYDVLRKP